jgi:hypothetical protein
MIISMKRVERAINNAEKLLPGLPSAEGGPDHRWEVIIKVGEHIETNPQEVWLFIRKWATHPDDDLRMAIATCLLEHLLEYHFNEYFPKVREACHQSKRFAWTFDMCAQFGQANHPENSKLFKELKNELA